MKLHTMDDAPNPRRVHIFLHEKGIYVPRHQVDMRGGELRSDAFLALNPMGQIPVLELDDGTCISESMAICRYFEVEQPQPALFGSGSVEQASVEMWNRRVELGLLAPVGVAWRNGPVVAKLAPGRFRQIPEARADAEAQVARFQQRLDGWLADREFLAGDRFTVADITLQCTIDFAAGLVELPIPGDLQHLHRWHQAVSQRPSAAA